MAHNLYYGYAMPEDVDKNNLIPLKEIIGEVEKKHIVEALESSGWIQAKAARALNVSQRVLGYKIKKYGITLKKGRQKGQKH